MILLIDNYDSFSYNLYQLVGEIVTEEQSINEYPGDECLIKKYSSDECSTDKHSVDECETNAYLKDEFKTNELQIDECTPKKHGFKDDAAEEIMVIRNDEMTVEEIDDLSPDKIILSPGPGRPEDAGVCMEVVKKLGHKIPILGVCLGHQSICAAFGATVTYAKQLMHGKQSDVKFAPDCLLFKGCPPVSPVARYHSLAADEATLPDELVVTASTTDGEVMAVKHKDYPIYGVQFHPESIMTPEGKRMLRNFIQG